MRLQTTYNTNKIEKRSNNSKPCSLKRENVKKVILYGNSKLSTFQCLRKKLFVVHLKRKDKEKRRLYNT